MRDSFFEKKVCDRCGGSLKDGRKMSKMNADCLCMECIEKEKKHPKYEEACKIELEECKNGNTNYQGMFAGQEYPFGYTIPGETVCCSEKDCKINTPFLVATIDDGKEKIALCPNHSIMYAMEAIPEDTLKKYPSDTKVQQVCEICGDHGVLYNSDEVQFKLCKKHLKRLLKRSLRPDEFKKLYDGVGNVFLLHDDFYDPETGLAFQPVDDGKDDFKGEWYMRMIDGSEIPFYIDDNDTVSPFDRIPSFDSGEYYSVDLADEDDHYEHDRFGYTLVPKKDVVEVFFRPY